MGFAHSKFYAQRSTSIHNDEVPENCLRQESMCFNLAFLKKCETRAIQEEIIQSIEYDILAIFGIHGNSLAGSYRVFSPLCHIRR